MTAAIPLIGVLGVITTVILAGCSPPPFTPPAPVAPTVPPTGAAEAIGSWSIVGGDRTALGVFNGPQSVRLDLQGFIYVADARNYRVQKLAADGKALQEWRWSSERGQPSDIAVDSQGNVYVALPKFGRIKKFSPTGQELAEWGSQGNGPGQFQALKGIAVDAQTSLYATDEELHRIQRFSPSGAPDAPWGKEGTGPGELKVPGKVDVDGQGNIYVVDGRNDRVQKFSTTGQPLDYWKGEGDSGGTPFISDVALDRSGNLYVADLNHRSIRKLSPTGQQLAAWRDIKGPPGSGIDEGPRSLAVTDSGELLLTFSGSSRVQRVSPDGRVLADWGQDQGQSLNVSGLAVNSQGSIFAQLGRSPSVASLSATAPPTSILKGACSDGVGYGIALDLQDNLYLSCTDGFAPLGSSVKGRVVKVSPSGQPLDMLRNKE